MAQKRLNHASSLERVGREKIAAAPCLLLEIQKNGSLIPKQSEVKSCSTTFFQTPILHRQRDGIYAGLSGRGGPTYAACLPEVFIFQKLIYKLRKQQKRSFKLCAPWIAAVF